MCLLRYKNRDFDAFYDKKTKRRYEMEGMQCMKGRYALMRKDLQKKRFGGLLRPALFTALLCLCLAVTTWATDDADVMESCPPAPVEMMNAAAEKIYTGLITLDEDIRLEAYGLNLDQLVTVYEEVAKSAEFFYLDSVYWYTCDMETGKILSLLPTYSMTGAALIEAQRTYTAKLDEILSYVSEDWTDFEKVLFLHDYLARQFSYDQSLEIYDAFTFLTGGKGVCQSYALTYETLLDTLGIENQRVISDEMNHTWTQVKLDGVWYHVDVTWDDPTNDQWGQAFHRYFLLSDAEMQKREHTGWRTLRGEESTPCTDTRYDDAFWKTVRTPFVPFEDGLWYYMVNETGEIRAWDIEADTHKTVYTMKDRWTKDTTVYTARYSGLIRCGDLLLFNTPTTLCALHPETGVAEVIHTHTGTGSICGISMAPGAYDEASDAYTVTYLVRTDAGQDNGTIFSEKITGNSFTFTLTGAVTGYFARDTFRVTLTRQGTPAGSFDGVRSADFLEGEQIFKIDGIRPGKYTLTVTQIGSFTVTYKDLYITRDTDLRTSLNKILSSIPMLSGDLDGDGRITPSDVVLLTKQFGRVSSASAATGKSGDLNGDGIVDIMDLAIQTRRDHTETGKDALTLPNA